MQLFYLPDLQNDTATLDAVESKHLVRVLRKKQGDLLDATDGRGQHLTCELIDANPKKAVLQVLERKEVSGRKASLTLAIAPTKNMDRLEWLVEKATEIGMERIVPLLCDHSERKVIKEERLERIALSAMKQSLRMHLPEILPLTPFSDWVQQVEGPKFICHLNEENPGPAFQRALVSGQSATVLIGPEGDFSPAELALAEQNGFTQVTLGNARLRTETAGLAAVHIFALNNSTPHA